MSETITPSPDSYVKQRATLSVCIHASATLFDCASGMSYESHNLHFDRREIHELETTSGKIT
jgi:hypothetical protein